MRYALSLLPVIVLCAMLEAAQAAAATIEGSWSGSGLVTGKNWPSLWHIKLVPAT